jgi:hypothetical protein
LANRCLYCGETSWRPLKWLVDDQFCSRNHKESYNDRLRKIVAELATYQNYSAEAARAGLDPATPYSPMQPASRAGLPGPLPILTSMAAPTPVRALMAAAILLRDFAIIDEPREIAVIDASTLALAPFADLIEMIAPANCSPENGSTASRPVMPIALPLGLEPHIVPGGPIGDGLNAVAFWPCLELVEPVAAMPSSRSVTTTLPPAFENHVQINRWGLRIRFLKI